MEAYPSGGRHDSKKAAALLHGESGKGEICEHKPSDRETFNLVLCTAVLLKRMYENFAIGAKEVQSEVIVDDDRDAGHS